MFVKPPVAVGLGLLCFAAGAVAGALYAPAPGERTRRRLRRATGELADRAAGAAEAAAEVVERAGARLR